MNENFMCICAFDGALLIRRTKDDMVLFLTKQYIVAYKPLIARDRLYFLSLTSFSGAVPKPGLTKSLVGFPGLGVVPALRNYTARVQL
jgi:hypothetical protein